MISKKRDIRLVLDNIRSVYNVGSIFRTAETLGLTKIYCLGTTPTPLDRFDRPRKDLAKVALGAEKIISWEQIRDLDSKAHIDLLRDLKREGFEILALEQAKTSVDYKKVKIDHATGACHKIKAAIILGNEVRGVAPELLEMADTIAEIPLLGQKESLNVSVAAGVFLYRLLD